MGEIYWNFSTFGVFIFFFLFGIFAKNYDLIKNDYLSDIQLITLSSISYLGFIIWRGSISTTLILFFINLFFLIFLLLLISYFLRKK